MATSPSPVNPSPAHGGLLLLLGCLVWAVVQTVSSANLDGYADMLESYAWGQTMPWGTFKHPPLFAWITHLWFQVFPNGVLPFFVLAYVNICLALLGVMALARKLGYPVLALPAAQLLLLAFPFTTLASKFNANSMLVSLWPWAAACMLGSWQAKGARGWLYTLALGVLGAAGLLAKYYTGVFMLGLLLAAVLSAPGRRWLASPRPWLALALCVLLLVPHIQWLMANNYQTLSYVEKHGDGQVHWKFLFTFALAPVLYWLLAWVACLLVAGRQLAGRGWRFWLQLAARSWQPRGRDDVLFWLAFFPWAITLLFGIAGYVLLSIHWINPIGYAFALLWLRNLVGDLPTAGQQRVAQSVNRVWQWSLVVVLLLGLVWTVVSAQRGDRNYYRPDAEVAQAIVQQWRQQHPDEPLRWVGGAWAFNGVVAFYGDPAVRVLPGLPDQAPATFDPQPGWQRQGGLLFCPSGELAAAAGHGAVATTACDQQAQQWLQAQGQPVRLQSLAVRRSGWRFPQARFFGYRVYSYLPQRP